MAIGRLLSSATMRHLHADWHLPVDWLGTPGFVLCEQEWAEGDEEIVACLAVGADPPPAAWVRVAAVKRDLYAERWLHEMLGQTLPWLRDHGVSILGWLAEEEWPERWLAGLGFRRVNWIITYSLNLTPVKATIPGPVAIRPATPADAPRLAEIEREAFDPLWRHSRQGVLAAFQEAMSFDVAELEGRVVGFQYSVDGHDGDSAHLVRLTVAPEAQGQGIGSSLLWAAMQAYGEKGLRRVTLNTQADNHASHRLYKRFGFQELANRVAVWAMPVE